MSRVAALILALLPCLVFATDLQNAGPHTVTLAPITGNTLVVSQDGSGAFTSVQAAIDAVPENQGATHTILIKPGVYRERIRINDNRSGLTLLGASGHPKDVIITFDLPAQGRGTADSASAVFAGDDTVARNITFENSFIAAEHPLIRDGQAVAVLTLGDRQIFENCRFLGHQDTLFVDRAGNRNKTRQYFRHCEIVGDVDFIFGSATAVFDQCIIRALSRNKPVNGYLTAASTYFGNPYGLLITHSRLESDAEAGSFFLGRPWHPSKNPKAIGQVLIRDSWLGAHIHPEGWTDMSGFKHEDARLFEYRNTGDGAQPNAKRRQLSDADAAHLTPADYLRGDDSWTPEIQPAH